MKQMTVFVAPVPEEKREAYFRHARIAAELFKEFGALQYGESLESDVPEGETTSFPIAVDRQPGEGIVVAFAIWPSKEVADEALPKIMNDPRMDFGEEGVPFDGERAFWGLFEMVVEA